MFARFLLSIGALATLTAAVTYNCDVENDIDYVGQDVGSAQGDVNSCCTHCFMNSKCNAWTWTSYNGGTCWLKRDVNKFVVNPGAKSAHILLGFYSNYTYPQIHCRLYEGVDFEGNDVGNAKASQAKDCCDLCRKKQGCRAYSWNNYNGGTCWFKSYRGTPVVKAGVTSGDAYDNTDAIYAIERGVDYVDHDISNAPAKTVDDCIAIAKEAYAKDWATHTGAAFSWSNNNGGTCWLKSSKNSTVANSGVTSGIHL